MNYILPLGKIRIKLDYFLFGVLLFTLVPLVYLPKLFAPKLFNLVPFWKEGIVLSFFCFVLFKRRKQIRSIPVLPVILFLIVALIGGTQLLAGRVPAQILAWGLMPYGILFGTIFVLEFEAIENIIHLCLGLIFSSSICGLGLIWDFFFRSFQFLYLEGIYQERGFSRLGEVFRPGFLFTGSTVASLLVALFVGVLFFLLLFVRSRTWVPLILFGIVTGSAGVLITFARIGYVGVVIFVFVGVLSSAFLFRRENSNILYLIGGIALLPLIVTLPVGIYKIELIERIRSTFTNRVFQDLANIHRFEAWFHGLNEFTQTPILGRGIGLAQPRIKRFLFIEHHESAVIGVLAEGGIIVFGCFIAYFVISGLKNLVVTINHQSPHGLYSIALLVGTFMMAFANPIFSEISFSFMAGLIITLTIRWPELSIPPAERHVKDYNSNLR